MDPLSVGALGAGLVTGGIGLTALFNKNTSKLTKAAALSAVATAAINIASVPAMENSGSGGLVFLFAAPALAGLSALGATWSLAAMYEGRATRRRLQVEPVAPKDDLAP